MSLTTWKCLVCEKDFKPGEWACADGQSNHIVQKKEYLLADAPTDAGHPANGGMDSKRDGRTRICNIPPDKNVVLNGEMHIQPGGYVEFIRGRFSTDNPEIQYYLEKTRGSSFVTEEQWQQAWLSQTQQLEIERGQVNALKVRLENERNELLAKTKESKKVSVPA